MLEIIRIKAIRILALWLVFTVSFWFILILPKIVLGGSASESFDGYGVGSLTTRSGGSGWNAAWTATGTGWDTITTGCSTGDCATGDDGTDQASGRVFSTDLTGGWTVTFLVKKTVVGGGTHQFTWRDSADATNVRLAIDNTPLFLLNGTNIGTPTEDTWHTIVLEANAYTGSGCSARQVRGKVDAGAFSACINYTTATDPNEFFMEYTGAASRKAWIDEFVLTEEAGAGSGTPADTSIEVIWFTHEL